MALRNTNERIAPEYQLSADGQLALRMSNSRGPVRTPRPNHGRPVAQMRSQAELNVERQLRGHQEAFALLPNVLVEAIREREDKEFFEQPAPPLAQPAEVVELAPPTETDTVVTFPSASKPAGQATR